MGDFNLKWEEGHTSDNGKGEINKREDTLKVFAETNELVVMNTWFKQPPRWLYTWKSPMDEPTRLADIESDDGGSVFNPKMKKVKTKKTRQITLEFFMYSFVQTVHQDDIELQFHHRMINEQDSFNWNGRSEEPKNDLIYVLPSNNER